MEGILKCTFIFAFVLGLSLGIPTVRETVPHEAVGICPPVQGPTPVYLPDSNNCSIFYECSYGKPLPVECPLGLYFDPIHFTCTWPAQAGCKANQTVEIVPLTAVGECTAEEGSPTYLADSEDCSIFYECSNGVAWRHDCPPDLVFNPQLNVCDFPDKVECGSK